MVKLYPDELMEHKLHSKMTRLQKGQLFVILIFLRLRPLMRPKQKGEQDPEDWSHPLHYIHHEALH